MPAPLFRYVIRNSDGSIKAVSKAPTLAAGEGETLILHATHYAPTRYLYDFDLEQFIAIPQDEIADQQAAQQAAKVAARAAREQLVAEVKAQVDLMSAGPKEAWQKLGQLLGFDFGP
jgi:hypothetical protein